MDEWKYMHIDSEECAAIIGAEYPGISLLRAFDNELFKVPATSGTGGVLSLSELNSVISLRRWPEMIKFSEDYIKYVMQQEKTSLILFTGNVNKDKIKPYY